MFLVNSVIFGPCISYKNGVSLSIFRSKINLGQSLNIWPIWWMDIKRLINGTVDCANTIGCRLLSRYHGLIFSRSQIISNSFGLQVDFISFFNLRSGGRDAVFLFLTGMLLRCLTVNLSGLWDEGTSIFEVFTTLSTDSNCRRLYPCQPGSMFICL